jgi:hypothetical protein
MPAPKNILLYRMVHWENVKYILEFGMSCRGHELADPNYVNIGMARLIENRHEFPISIQGAGELGEYVPFYFAGHSPMLYTIKQGYSGVQQRPQNDIVFVVCHYRKIKELGLQFVFTDRNAKMAIANYYTEEADFEQLDWLSIQTKHWKSDETDIQRRDKKQAEFLVRNHVPVSAIAALVVKTEARKLYFEEIIRILGLEIAVHVDTNCQIYY